MRGGSPERAPSASLLRAGQLRSIGEYGSGQFEKEADLIRSSTISSRAPFEIHRELGLGGVRVIWGEGSRLKRLSSGTANFAIQYLDTTAAKILSGERRLSGGDSVGLSRPFRVRMMNARPLSRRRARTQRAEVAPTSSTEVGATSAGALEPLPPRRRRAPVGRWISTPTRPTREERGSRSLPARG